MARKHQLRDQRKDTVINATSKQQESTLIQALYEVEVLIYKKFGNKTPIEHIKRWYLKDIVTDLQTSFPESQFHHHFDTTHISPDGGILHLKSRYQDELYPILISEVKNQGTNDLRRSEGLEPQARGNAIERLGKNLIALRAALMRENIFPFVCFGYGCDFEPTSSILDRVTSMAMFGELNKTYLHNEEGGKLNRGSFYFREDEWSVDEMVCIMHDIAERSILYYISKYGKEYF